MVVLPVAEVILCGYTVCEERQSIQWFESEGFGPSQA